MGRGGPDCFGHCRGWFWHSSPIFFCKKYFSCIILNQRKKLGFEMSFYPPEIGRNLWGGIAPNLCLDWGAHVKNAVFMPRLRCSCQDWGAHAEIEVLKSPQSWPEHRNLGMSTSNSAWAPQSKHSNYLPKSNSLFQGDKMKFRTQAFSSSQVMYIKNTFGKKIGVKYLMWLQQWLELSTPLYMRSPPPTRLPNQTSKI